MIKKIVFYVFVILVLASITSFITFSRLKVAYVNTYSIYNEFKLKKELEEKLNKTQLTRKVLLDSLRIKIQMASLDKSKAEGKEFYFRMEEMKQMYFKREKEYTEENTAQAQKYTDEVWEQLNQYIKEYGKEKGYDYIMGATGEGNLMYAKEQHDISKELIQYVNEKYAGK